MTAFHHNKPNINWGYLVEILKTFTWIWK